MKMICIVCPNGCHLTLNKTAKGVAVSGNKCPRGEVYGNEEMTAPKRMVTAVARTTSDKNPCVPVKTTAAIPKKMIPGLLKKIYSLKVKLPVKRGEIAIVAIGSTKEKVVFTRSIGK